MNVKKEQLFTTQSSVEWESMAEGVRRKIMSFGDKGMATYVEFQKNAVGALHHHPHIQITFIQSGQFEVQIDGKKQILKAGDFFYVASNLEHGVVALEGGVLVDFFHPMREDFLGPK